MSENDSTGAAAKKLSKLQKQILTLAFDNRLREGRDDTSNAADLFYSQILAEVYRFPTTQSLRYGGYDEHAGQRICGTHIFELTVIGKARYNAAQAAISRAMMRLESRELITCIRGSISHWAGCNLTPAGVELAKRLTERSAGQKLSRFDLAGEEQESVKLAAPVHKT
jgi:hypothetical protein